MVRLIGALMTAFACGCFGFRASMTLKKRMTSLFDIISSLEILESEIGFSINRLKKAFERADKNGLFKTAAQGLDSQGIKKSWERAIEEQAPSLCLTDDDCGILRMLGKTLGKTDADDQIKNIRYIKGLVASQAHQAEEEYSRMGRLYRSGGVLCGILAVIMLF